MIRKYGGGALRSSEQFEVIADHLPDEACVLVLSAPYGRTDELIELTSGLDAKTRNLMLSMGEMESVFQMNTVLQQRGRKVQVLTYQEIGLTASKAVDGEIISCQPDYIQSLLAQGITVIVPGFVAQCQDELAILKRGGSDETAIALGIALKTTVEIFSDVDAIYDQQKPLETIQYDQLLALIKDNRPMSLSSIRMAKAAKLSLRFQHWKGSKGTIIA